MLLGIDASQEAVDLFNRQFGLDQPFLTRFWNYLINIVTKLDFGILDVCQPH
ncbi:MAG: hypothetical protein LBS84_13735 [Clostridiales bacterium]|nr:hypothetical protein [Clostridiales bacterium]